MSEQNSPIDKEPSPNSNGNSKLAIELPNDEKKELELVVKNDKVVNQAKPKYVPEIISNKKVLNNN